MRKRLLYKVLLWFAIFAFFLSMQLGINVQAILWYEDFNGYSNGTINAVGSPIGVTSWGADRLTNPIGTFGFDGSNRGARESMTFFRITDGGGSHSNYPPPILSSKETTLFLISNLDEYRTKVIGNWNSASTRERFDWYSWVSVISTLTASDDIITIQNGHTVTVNSGVSVGGDLIFQSGYLFSHKDKHLF